MLRDRTREYDEAKRREFAGFAREKFGDALLFALCFAAAIGFVGFCFWMSGANFWIGCVVGTAVSLIFLFAVFMVLVVWFELEGRFRRR